MKFLLVLDRDIFFEMEFADMVNLIEICFYKNFLMVTPD